MQWSVSKTCKVILQDVENCIWPLERTILHDSIGVNYSGSQHSQIIGYLEMEPFQIQRNAINKEEINKETVICREKINAQWKLIINVIKHEILRESH